MKNAGDPINANEFATLQRDTNLPQIGGDGVNVSNGPNGLHIKARSQPDGVMNEAALDTIGVNTGATDLGKYAACEIVGGYNSAADAQWKRQIEIKLPTSAAVGFFAICAQDIKSGYANKIYTSGICLVQIRTASGDLFADVSPGNPYLIGSSTDGGVEIIEDYGGPSSTTHLALVRFRHGGTGGGGDSRWTDSTGAIASATTFTSSDPALLKGLPIRYETTAGGAGVYNYAVISNVSGTTITILGKSLSGLTFLGVWVGTPELVVQAKFLIGGLYAGTAQDILAALMKTTEEWQASNAWLVNFKCWSGTLGAGTAKVNVKIGSTSVDTNGVVPSTSGVASAAIANPAIAYSNKIEIAVTVTDATASDLTVACLFVLF